MTIGEGEKPVVDIRNRNVLQVEPPGVPIPGGLVGRRRRIHALRAEHEHHTSAVDHGLVLGLLFDTVKELPEANVGADSEMPFAERHEVGEKKIGVGAYVVRLEAVSVKNR
jgi:hypothetical protein